MLRLFFISVSLVISSCGHHSNRDHGTITDGGPCDYDSARFEAKVIDITAVESRTTDSVYKVKVSINNKHKLYNRDTIFLNHMTSDEINSAYLRKQHIELGKVITGMAFYRLTGTCTPEIYRFDPGKM
jgi:hypothetical protein